MFLPIVPRILEECNMHLGLHYAEMVISLTMSLETGPLRKGSAEGKNPPHSESSSFPSSYTSFLHRDMLQVHGLQLPFENWMETALGFKTAEMQIPSFTEF